MAKYEYTGDGTVTIDGVGLVSPGTVVEAPSSLNLGKRGDFKTASGAKDEDVALTVEVPVEQPDQTPEDEKQFAYVSDAERDAPAVAAPTTTTTSAAPVATTEGK